MESDGIDEAFEGTSRVLATTAARVADQLARELERRTLERRDEALREAARDESRAQALWEQTRAELAPVMEQRWWEQATPQSIAQAYGQARAFDHRPEARPLVERIETEVRDRYGVSIDELREQAETDAAAQAAEADRDRAEAQRLMADADRADSRPENETGRADELRQEAADSYDSAERRETLASDLRALGVDEEAVEARVTADVGQGRPAAEAARPSDRPAKARKTRGRGRGTRSREAQRG